MNNNIKLILLFFGWTFSWSLSSQQLAHSSFLDDSKVFWNPAMVASGNEMKTNLFFRQQWVSFAKAPTTGYISFEYPFLDFNMSAGGVITFDRTGLVSKKGLQLNYAYKLRDIFVEEDQLSLGLSAGINIYDFDEQGAIVNQPEDVLINGQNTSSFYPTIGGGLFFTTTTKMYSDNVFYLGLAFRDLYTTNVLVNGYDQQREDHLHFHVGTKIFQYDSYIEPSLTINYSGPDNLDLRIGSKFEMRDVFWVGLGYSTVNELSILGGIILPGVGSKYSTLRIGVLGNIFVNDNINEFGPGLEFFASYRFEME